MIIKAAKDTGVKRIFVQHPAMALINMPVPTQMEAVKMGALLEYVLGEALPSQKDFDHWTGLIKEVGPENVVIGTDLGQWGRSTPTDGYKVIIPRMLKAGFTQQQLDVMMKTNPARLLGLEKW